MVSDPTADRAIPHGRALRLDRLAACLARPASPGGGTCFASNAGLLTRPGGTSGLVGLDGTAIAAVVLDAAAPPMHAIEGFAAVAAFAGARPRMRDWSRRRVRFLERADAGNVLAHLFAMRGPAIPILILLPAQRAHQRRPQFGNGGRPRPPFVVVLVAGVGGHGADAEIPDPHLFTPDGLAAHCSALI